jgi:hypothetical protein
VHILDTGVVRILDTGVVRILDIGVVRILDTGVVRILDIGVVRILEIGVVRMLDIGVVPSLDTDAVCSSSAVSPLSSRVQVFIFRRVMSSCGCRVLFVSDMFACWNEPRVSGSALYVGCLPYVYVNNDNGASAVVLVVCRYLISSETESVATNGCSSGLKAQQIAHMTRTC